MVMIIVAAGVGLAMGSLAAPRPLMAFLSAMSIYIVTLLVVFSVSQISQPKPNLILTEPRFFISDLSGAAAEQSAENCLLLTNVELLLSIERLSWAVGDTRRNYSWQVSHVSRRSKPSSRSLDDG
jgi:hypothetical protein